MNRREFSKRITLLGAGLPAGLAAGQPAERKKPLEGWYEEPARQLPIRKFDVVVAGGGTAGVVTAIAAARQGAKTMLIERKGYPGGTVVEGGTALHSYFNLWKAFPGVARKQVVQGIPQEIVDRLAKVGGTSGHAEMVSGYNYDSVCTAIDTELYKLVTFEMLVEAGVSVAVNTLLAGAITEGSRLKGVIAESRAGREAIMAKSFVDCTGYGDLAAFAGAKYTEPNDYPVVNSMGVGGVNVARFHDYLESQGAVTQLARGWRGGKEGQIVRVQSNSKGLPKEFHEEARKIMLAMVTTTVHDDYFMFIKMGFKMPVSPTNRDAVSQAELELRKRQAKAIELFRKYVPGCEKAFIARTSPSLNIRRARVIACDYDLTRADVLEGKHFDDDIMAYGFHDNAPRLQIKNGGTYGIPYKALRVAGLENLLAAGMLITSNHDAHMSTRNTVCCMGQGQAAGTAAALCAAKSCGTRDLAYPILRDALLKAGVHLES
ncbi:MAG: FAD-dependent oxidoreductase [Verrucomicrobiota bacterium]